MDTEEKKNTMYRVAIALVFGLSACVSTAPNDVQGVGFGGYETARASQSGLPSGSGVISNADLAAAGLPTSSTGVVAGASPSGVSDEQDFDAVSSRETIESDAARLARLREGFELVEPTAVPTRAGETPSIVAFAIKTTNQPGERLYRRSRFRATTKFKKSCTGHATLDVAQEIFLAAGGPEKDKAGMDPDGDGFACGWDPRPYRQALAN